MKKTRILAELLCIVMILSSFGAMSLTAAAASVGDTVTESELMAGTEAASAVVVDFNKGYTGFNSAKAKLSTEGNVTYLQQTAAGMETESLKTESGGEILREPGSLTKIKFRYAHNTENADTNDLIVFDGGIGGGYRARFSLITNTDGVQQFFVLQNLNGTRNWGRLTLPANGQLAPNTWHELAVQCDVNNNLTIWAKIGCEGDYVMLASFKLWNDGWGNYLRMGYSGGKTGANSMLDVDYVKVYNYEKVTTEKLLEGTDICMQMDFKDTQSLLGGTLISATENTSGITANGLNLHADAKFEKDSNNARWTIADSSLTFPEGSVIHTKFTENSESTSALVYFEIYGDGYRRRFGFTRSAVPYVDSVGWKNAATEIMSKGNPVELIVRNSGDNNLQFWLKNADGVWNCLVTTVGLAASSNTGSILIGTQNGANIDMEFFRMYKIPEEQKSLDEILAGIGENHAMTEFVDFEVGYDGKTYNGVTVDAGVKYTSDYTVLDAEGNLQIKSQTTESNWYRPNDATLTNIGDAVEVRAKWKEGSVMTFSFGTGSGTRSFMKLHGSGKLEFYGDYAGTGEVHSTNIIDYSDEWVTYLITREGETSMGLRYKSDSDAGYQQNPKLVTTTLRTGGGSDLKFVNEGYTEEHKDDVYIDYYKVYRTGLGKTDAEAKPAAARRMLFSEEFEAEGDGLTNKYVEQNSTYEQRRSITAEGTLKMDYKGLTAEQIEKEAEPDYKNNFSQYRVLNAAIPAGGYAEARYKTSGDFVLSFYNDNSQQNWRAVNSNGGSKYLKDGAFVNAPGIINEANQWQTVRIVRSADGLTYSLYLKKADDTAWVAIDENVAARTNSGNTFFNAEKYFSTVNTDTENCSAEVDYLKIYGPADVALTLTDGAEVSAAPAAGKDLVFNEIRAIVAPSTVNQKLILAGYDTNKALVSISNETIAASENETVKILTVPTDKNIAEVKVFLWDNFGTMTPVVANDGAFTIAQ